MGSGTHSSKIDGFHGTHGTHANGASDLWRWLRLVKYVFIRKLFCRMDLIMIRYYCFLGKFSRLGIAESRVSARLADHL